MGCARQGEYNGPVRPGYLPIRRDEGCSEDDHANYDDEREQEGEPETFQNAGGLDEEIGPLDFFFGCLPGHVVGEEMREKRGRQMDPETPEEEEAAKGSVSMSRTNVGRSNWKRRDGMQIRTRMESTSCSL